MLICSSFPFCEPRYSFEFSCQEAGTNYRINFDLIIILICKSVPIHHTTRLLHNIEMTGLQVSTLIFSLTVCCPCVQLGVKTDDNESLKHLFLCFIEEVLDHFTIYLAESGSHYTKCFSSFQIVFTHMATHFMLA